MTSKKGKKRRKTYLEQFEGASLQLEGDFVTPGELLLHTNNCCEQWLSTETEDNYRLAAAAKDVNPFLEPGLHDGIVFFA